MCKHDQTCYLHFSYLTLARGVVVNPCSLQNWAPASKNCAYCLRVYGVVLLVHYAGINLVPRAGLEPATHYLVLPPRIEQGSSDFQSVAMTTSAKGALFLYIRLFQQSRYFYQDVFQERFSFFLYHRPTKILLLL